MEYFRVYKTTLGMDLDQIRAYDKSNMFDVLKDFPQQVEEAVSIATAFEFKHLNTEGIQNVVVNGLGGSAIGGDFVRSYAAYDMKVPMVVNRNYNLPGFADENTLAVISSYSGNTEETLSAFKEARERNCRILCITSGGEVERIANDNNIDVLKIPGGLQPRCALGYSFFSLLIALTKLGLIPDKSPEITATIKHLQNLSHSYSYFSSEHNHPIMIAEEVKSHLPVIYSSSDVLDAVNLRWQGQISENAEVLAYGNFVPEMNHNELVGWNLNEEILSRIVVILLCDRDDNDRVKLRMKITTDIYKEKCSSIIAVESDAETKLERIFELTYLGDWMSFYLAILNGVDPTPVEAINYLKNKLSEAK